MICKFVECAKFFTHAKRQSSVRFHTGGAYTLYEAANYCYNIRITQKYDSKVVMEG